MAGSDDDDAPDIDALVAELRARVEERRRSGEYPPGLEEDLARHVRMILGHWQDERPAIDLHSPLAQARAAVPRGPVPAALESGMPGGKALHASVARLVGRHTQGLSQQMTSFADPVVATLAALVEAVEELRADIGSHLDAIYERQAAQERAMTRAGLDLSPASPPPSGS
jgi:hypothetical protein